MDRDEMRKVYRGSPIDDTNWLEEPMEGSVLSFLKAE
jgi:hypothetical protein